jgi:enoyl-CoA hydratase/carnithine racemase
MKYEYILSERDSDGIVVLTINDPDAKNAVNPEMNQEIIAECLRIEADPAARVLIVTGSGSVFCSGANMRWLKSADAAVKQPTVRQQMFPHLDDIRAVTTGLRRMTKPVIAAINGPAVGSGLGIAAACDMRIASRDARFGWVFVRRGLVPQDGSLALLLELIGYARTFAWGIAGRTLDAPAALSNGFLNEVVEDDQLLPRCRELALEIIRNVPPITAQLFKAALTETLHVQLEEALRITDSAQRISRATEDHAEALQAYSEKRPPVWKGR